MKKTKKVKHVNPLLAESPAYKVFKVINCTVLILFSLLIVVPYLNVLAKAFNDAKDTMQGGIGLWPRKFTWANFALILDEPSFFRALILSIIRVITGTLLGLIVQFAAAYAMTKQFPGKTWMTVMLMIPMYIAAGMLPTYVLYSKLKLLNNFLVYILPGCFSFYNAVIIRSFMQGNIPYSLYESAYLDGANEVQVFSKIVVPLCKPVMATVGLWLMVHHWSDWTSTLYYIRDQELHTLQYKMMEVLKEAERIKALIAAAAETGEDVSAIMANMSVTTESIQNAQIILTTIPIVITYPFLQKYFVKGTVVGAVKG